MSHDDLSERIRRGDRDAMVEFIEMNRSRLLAFIASKLSDALGRKVDASDILQEVAISAVDGLTKVKLDDRDPFHWLCRLADRRIVDAYRRHFGAEKRSGHREVALRATGGDSSRAPLVDLLVASITSPSKALARNDREQKLWEALQALPEENQLALRLRYVEGLPSKQIAQQLNKSDGATRVLLSRSLARLQALLGEDRAFESFRSATSDPLES
jgi:RNA polymerase sigma-70 factor (ECF subfamily)